MGITKVFWFVTIFLYISIGVAAYFQLNYVVSSMNLIKDPATKDTIGGIFILFVLWLWWDCLSDALKESKNDLQ